MRAVSAGNTVYSCWEDCSWIALQHMPFGLSINCFPLGYSNNLSQGGVGGFVLRDCLLFLCVVRAGSSGGLRGIGRDSQPSPMQAVYGCVNTPPVRTQRLE